ncbi:hypothetical protein AB0H58_06560 [Nocardia neocaledoniensis]|uniref:hypothetical protein n=1 Tax=Nocardia neocaledoniensis TaxID=236511 RepID=UPI0033EE0C4F
MAVELSAAAVAATVELSARSVAGAMLSSAAVVATSEPFAAARETVSRSVSAEPEGDDGSATVSVVDADDVRSAAAPEVVSSADAVSTVDVRRRPRAVFTHSMLPPRPGPDAASPAASVAAYSLSEPLCRPYR